MSVGWVIFWIAAALSIGALVAITTVAISRGPSESGERVLLRFTIIWPSGPTVYEWRW